MLQYCLLKSLAEFAPPGANKIKSVFSGGMYVEKNTARPVNVRVVRSANNECAATGRKKLEKVALPSFSTLM
jgi:hypothetical protein